MCKMYCIYYSHTFSILYAKMRGKTFKKIMAKKENGQNCTITDTQRQIYGGGQGGQCPPQNFCMNFF